MSAQQGVRPLTLLQLHNSQTFLIPLHHSWGSVMTSRLLGMAGQHCALSKLDSSLYLRFLRLRQYFSDLDGKERLLVLQMAKVRSSTVVSSLRKSKLACTVYHVHFLSRAGSDFIHGMMRQAFGDCRRVPSRDKRHLLKSRFVAEQVARERRLNRRWKIVSLIREPIAMIVSGFFRNVDLRLPELKRSAGMDTLGMDSLIERFYLLQVLPRSLSDVVRQSVSGRIRDLRLCQ